MLKLVSPREELGKNINADEAAAMGAVYQAAALSKAFKVKPFVVRDAVIYPILVSLAMGPTLVASPSETSVHLNLPLFLIPREISHTLTPTHRIFPGSPLYLLFACYVGGVHKGGGGGAWGSKPKAQ